LERPWQDPELQSLDFDHDVQYDGLKTKEVEAASIITLSCSPKVQRIVKCVRNPHKMWNTLEIRLDTARSYISRQDILCQISACRHKEDKPLTAYFPKLSNYCIHLDHTDDAITDRDVCMGIFTSLPLQYVMILIVLKDRRPLPTPKEAMHNLLKEKLQPASPRNLWIHSQGPSFTLNAAATISEAVGMVDVEDVGDAVDKVDMLDLIEAVEPETAMKVSAPITKLMDLQQMHGNSRNVPRWQQTTVSIFVCSVGLQDTSKSIESFTNV
jgi:hypothetical protein